MPTVKKVAARSLIDGIGDGFTSLRAAENVSPDQHAILVFDKRPLQTVNNEQRTGFYLDLEIETGLGQVFCVAAPISVASYIIHI